MPLSELILAEVWIIEDGAWVMLDRRGWRVDAAGAPGRRPRLFIVAEHVQHSLVDEAGVYHGEWQLRHPNGEVLIDAEAFPVDEVDRVARRHPEIRGSDAIIAAARIALARSSRFEMVASDLWLTRSAEGSSTRLIVEFVGGDVDAWAVELLEVVKNHGVSA